MDVDLLIMLTFLPLRVRLAKQLLTNVLLAIILLVQLPNAILVIKVDPRQSLLPIEVLV